MTGARRIGRAAAVALAALAVLVVAAAPASAHRMPGTTTTVTWNERTGLLEIVHRLHAHDAETGIEPFYDAGRLSVADPEDQARIALYVEERFAIEVGGREIALRTLGAALEGDYLVVLQESPRRLRGGRVRVRNDILRDAFPGQLNEVFLRDGGKLETLRFSGRDRWLTARLRQAPG